METYFAVLLGIVGLLVGSFLNVVIARVPEGESVVCSAIAMPGVRHRDRVPGQHPGGLLVAAAGPLSRTAVSRSAPGTRWSSSVTPRSGWSCCWSFGWTWELPAYLYLASVGLALAAIDLDTKRLPNALTLPCYVVLGGSCSLPAAVDGDGTPICAPGSARAALFAFYFLLVAGLPVRHGLGRRQARGRAWPLPGLARLGRARGRRFPGVPPGCLDRWRADAGPHGPAARRKIPFGPFMLLGALLAILWGGQLWGTYRRTRSPDSVVRPVTEFTKNLA